MLKALPLLCLAVFVLYNILWYLTEPCPVSEFLELVFDREVLGYSLIYSTVVPGLCLFLCWHLVGLPYFGQRSFRRLAILAVAILLTNFLLTYLFGWVFEMISPSDDDIEFWMSAYVFSVLASLLSFAYMLAFYCRLAAVQYEENKRLKIAYLKMQLDPHFLFNSVNVIAELVHEDAGAAEMFAVKLSSVYRYVVSNIGCDTVAIKDEMRNADAYLDLMEMRYPHSVRRKIDSSLYECCALVVPLGVQMLMENAVKHNVHSAERPMLLEVFRADGFLSVRNSLSEGGSAACGCGIGLKNLCSQYRMLAGREIEVVKENDTWK